MFVVLKRALWDDLFGSRQQLQPFVIALQGQTLGLCCRLKENPRKLR